MQRCHEIYRESPSLEHRRSAIELLRVVGDRRVLPWISDYLADEDAGVRIWGIGVVIEMLFDGMIEPDSAQPFAAQAARPAAPRVRQKARFLERLIVERPSTRRASTSRSREIRALRGRGRCRRCSCATPRPAGDRGTRRPRWRADVR
jgi:hypothetical protein